MATARTPKSRSHLRLPDPPEREPEDMTSFNHLSVTGNAYLLTLHFGNPDTTIIGGEHYISPAPTQDMTGLRYSDLFIAFNADPETHHRSNACIISEQGKPPDFVLEIASRSTGRMDIGEKRNAYAALGIPEYWRFYETGEYHGARLAGDRLTDGGYVPIPIEKPAEGTLQSYSQVLDLHLRWNNGQLEWIDPKTGQHIIRFQDQEDRADRAEARVRELEEELRRLRNG